MVRGRSQVSCSPGAARAPGAPGPGAWTPETAVSERGLACWPHYVTPLGSLGWRIYSFHHLYSPPGLWSRVLNLLPCQASWSVTFRLPLSSDISIRALGSGALHNGGAARTSCCHFRGRSHAVQKPAFPSSCQGVTVGPPSVPPHLWAGTPWVKPGHSVQFHVMEDCWHQ